MDSEKSDKPPQTLAPGEVWGDYIGCYILWNRGDSGEDDRYHSNATTKAELISDCRKYFTDLKAHVTNQIEEDEPLPDNMTPDRVDAFVCEMKRRHRDDLLLIDDTLLNIEPRVEKHLSSGADDEFFFLVGLEVFISVGQKLEPSVKHHWSDAPTLPVGQTHGKWIGCYLLWLAPDHDGDPSYHSLATNKIQLIEDCRRMFGQLIEMKEGESESPYWASLEALPSEIRELMMDGLRKRHAADVAVMKALLADIEVRIDEHLARDVSTPLFEISGIDIRLGLGERHRSKRHGEYIE